MTVKELIEELKKCNPNADVYSYDSGNRPINSIEDYTGDGDYYVIE